MAVEADTPDGKTVQTMLYLWPAHRSEDVDLTREWSYEHFRATVLEAFVRDVVVPCAAEFEEEERRRPAS